LDKVCAGVLYHEALTPDNVKSNPCWATQWGSCLMHLLHYCFYHPSSISNQELVFLDVKWLYIDRHKNSSPEHNFV
jgi:hypothetical protein